VVVQPLDIFGTVSLVDQVDFDISLRTPHERVQGHVQADFNMPIGAYGDAH